MREPILKKEHHHGKAERQMPRGAISSLLYGPCSRHHCLTADNGNNSDANDRSPRDNLQRW
jgi:hypothetical protein